MSLLRLPGTDSLRGRLIWLAGATALAMAGLMFAVVWTLRASAIDRPTAEAITQAIVVIRSALQAVPLPERARLIEVATTEGRWRLIPESAAQPPTQLARIPVLRRWTREINARLGDDADVRFSPLPEVSLWAPVQLDGARWWVVVPLARFSGVLPWQLLGWLAVAAAVVLLGAVAVAIRLSRPLSALARASRELAEGRALSDIALPIAGPREVRELTQEFTQMVAARDAALDTRRVMLAGLPHDLKAPLTRLRARLELVNDAAVRDGLRGDAEDMQRVLEQFLAYLRGADPAAYQRMPIDLRVLVQERCTRWAESGVELRCTLQGTAPTTGDAALLARALDNLIDNALRYGAPPVIVMLSADTALTIAVADRGPGIASARRAEALQPFTRLDAARSGPGTGIGLALVAEIVKGHQGTLELDDTPGGGLTVRLMLPRVVPN
jgi:two-component system osmolarity sensor histidine kinase EnvZ